MTDCAVFSPSERSTDAAASRQIVVLADYRRLAENVEHIDPLHWCDRDLRSGMDELTYIVNEAMLARDIAAVLNAHLIAVELRGCLERIELLALHFADALTERVR